MVSGLSVSLSAPLRWIYDTMVFGKSGYLNEDAEICNSSLPSCFACE